MFRFANVHCTAFHYGLTTQSQMHSYLNVILYLVKTEFDMFTLCCLHVGLFWIIVMAAAL